MRPNLYGHRLTTKELEQLLASCSFETDQTARASARYLRKTRNSTLYVAAADNLPYKILIKQVKTGDAGAQYDALLTAHRKMKGGDYCVPAPLACIPEKNIIVMQFIEGQTLERVLLARDIAPDDKTRRIAQSARWLSLFHNAFEKRTAELGSIRSIESLKVSLGQAAKTLTRQKDLNAAWQWLLDRRHDMEKHEASQGFIHGDFKPENILYAEQGVFGIDFLLEDKGLHLMDLVQYANHMLFLAMKRDGTAYKASVDSWVSDFVESYTQTGGTIHPEAFGWLRLQHLLRYWSISAAQKNPIALLQARKMQNMAIELHRSIIRFS